MADEPSMDEILASLERLLQEGDSSNDEVESMIQPSAADAEIGLDNPGVHKTEVPVPQFFVALDRSVSMLSNNVAKSNPGEEVEDLELGAATNEQELDTSSTGAQELDSNPPVKRIVLTDAMMINEVQQSLPLDMDGNQKLGLNDFGLHHDFHREDDVEPLPSLIQASAAALDPIQWDEQELLGIIDQVTDDVCSAMASQLPEMIRKSLKDRLSGLIDERKENKDSDSGLKE